MLSKNKGNHERSLRDSAPAIIGNIRCVCVCPYIGCLCALAVKFSLCCNIVESYGSNLSTFGNEFFVGFYEHVHTAYTHQFFVHTLKTSSVSFKVTSLDGGFSYSGTCTRNSPATVNIPFSYEVRGNTYSWRRKGLKITSLETEPISVITWSYRSAADYMAYLAYPCHKQPTKKYTYYAMSSNGWSNQKSLFLLVGCHDDTSVTINAKASIVVPVDAQDSGSGTKTISSGQNYTFTLHSMQTFLVYVSYADLTASKIISDQPLTVISGHEAAQVPANTYDADPTSTQILPTVQWGKTFLLAPHTGQIAQSFRIIAYLDDTAVVRTCGTNSVTKNSMNADTWIDFYTSGSTYCSIESSNPIYIAQLGVSDSYSGGNYGDPCINTVAPVSQFTNTIQYTTLTAAYHYYSVVMPNDNYFTGKILYDGSSQTKSWTNIYYQNGSIAGYGYTSSTSGSHTLAHPNSNGKMFVSVFGWTRYGGYCYDSGMGLNPVNQLTTLPQISFTKEEFLVKENNNTAYVYLVRTKEFKSNVSVNFSVVPSPADTALSMHENEKLVLPLYISFYMIILFLHRWQGLPSHVQNCQV